MVLLCLTFIVSVATAAVPDMVSLVQLSRQLDEIEFGGWKRRVEAAKTYAELVKLDKEGLLNIWIYANVGKRKDILSELVMHIWPDIEKELRKVLPSDWGDQFTKAYYRIRGRFLTGVKEWNDRPSSHILSQKWRELCLAIVHEKLDQSIVAIQKKRTEIKQKAEGNDFDSLGKAITQLEQDMQALEAMRQTLRVLDIQPGEAGKRKVSRKALEDRTKSSIDIEIRESNKLLNTILKKIDTYEAFKQAIESKFFAHFTDSELLEKMVERIFGTPLSVYKAALDELFEKISRKETVLKKLHNARSKLGEDPTEASYNEWLKVLEEVQAEQKAIRKALQGPLAIFKQVDDVRDELPEGLGVLKEALDAWYEASMKEFNIHEIQQFYFDIALEMQHLMTQVNARFGIVAVTKKFFDNGGGLDKDPIVLGDIMRLLRTIDVEEAKNTMMLRYFEKTFASNVIKHFLDEAQRSLESACKFAVNQDCQQQAGALSDHLTDMRTQGFIKNNEHIQRIITKASEQLQGFAKSKGIFLQRHSEFAGDASGYEGHYDDPLGWKGPRSFNDAITQFNRALDRAYINELPLKPDMHKEMLKRKATNKNLRNKLYLKLHPDRSEGDVALAKELTEVFQDLDESIKSFENW